MAVVELQFRERAFLDIVGSEALRPPLAARVLEEIRPNIDGQRARLRLTGVAWAPPFLRAQPDDPGAVLVKVTLAIDLAGPRPDEQGDLAGRAAITRSVAAELWIEVAVARTGLTYQLVELRVLAPAATLPAVSSPLLIGGDRTRVDHGAVVVAGGIVSVRLASLPGDDVSGPVQDRLNGLDWARFMPGDLLAESVVDALDDALENATGWLDADLRVENQPRGRWNAPVSAGLNGSGPGLERFGDDGPVVRAGTGLVAVGALPFDFDLPFTLAAEAQFALVWPSSAAAPPVLAATTVLWADAADPDALASFGPLDLLRDEIRAGFDGRLDNTPAGALMVDHPGGALRVDTRRALTVPASRAWAGLVADATLDARGLTVTGALALRQPGEIDLRERRGHNWANLRPVAGRPTSHPDDPVAVS
jgi:hypothetical protein